MSPFKDRVIQIVQSVPKGKVISYGQVAAYAGLPRAAREVGWIMNGLEGSQQDLPWWRVLNNKGYISIRGNQTADKELQAKLLQSDGVEVSPDFIVDMKQYRYQPTTTELKQFELEESYITTLITKYGL